VSSAGAASSFCNSCAAPLADAAAVREHYASALHGVTFVPVGDRIVGSNGDFPAIDHTHSGPRYCPTQDVVAHFHLIITLGSN
jgi:hypothetical protein